MKVKLKSILFVVRDTKYFLSHRIPLVEKLINEGYSVHLCSMLHDDADIDRLTPLGVRFYKVPNLKGILGILFNIICCRIAIIKSKASLVQGISTKYNLILAAASFGSSARVVYLFAGLGTLFRSGLLRHRLGAYVYGLLFNMLTLRTRSLFIFMNRSDLIDFVSYSRLPKQRCHIISGSGVDLVKFSANSHMLKTDSDKLVIGFAGRLLRDKGILEFLEAAKFVSERYSNLVFEIAGDVDSKNPTSFSKDELLSSINQQNIKWLGEVKDIENVMSTWDIFCFPSYHEGLSLSLLQAAALGRQLVVSDIPGNRLVVKDPSYGYLFKAKDTQSIVEALIDAVKNQEYSRGKATRVMNYVREEFSVHAINQKYLALYQESEEV
jgi:glycosyltransferase involved in cell wall biosynthesis